MDGRVRQILQVRRQRLSSPTFLVKEPIFQVQTIPEPALRACALRLWRVSDLLARL